MKKIVDFLEKYNLSHPLLSLIPLTIGGIFTFLTGGLWVWFGGTLAVGFYLGREVTHASYPPGSGPWWRGFDLRNWSPDNHKDFWYVVILSVLFCLGVTFLL